MPIFAVCENLVPAAFDDIGAAVLRPDPEVTMTAEIRWPSREDLETFFFVLGGAADVWGGNPSCPGRVLIDFFVSRCNVALFLLDLCFSDFLLTLQQGSVHSLFYS